MPAEVPAVQLTGLRCQTSSGRITLDLPTLHICNGEHVAIVGHNGAGKSMLLRCLTGFAQASSGQLQVLGVSLTSEMSSRQLRDLRADVGQVLQGLHLVQRVSVIDNVLMGALGRQHGWRQVVRSWLRLPSAAQRSRALQALGAVGLAGRAEDRADRLSGGERQKVAIARMLMQGPRLILADEPTASLDPSAAQEICGLLRQAAQGQTLITVVHDPALLPLLADRVIGLRQGMLAFDCALSDLDTSALRDLYANPDQAMAPSAWESSESPIALNRAVAQPIL
jgi:phosphonate transport system ATP-binding protein